MAARELRERSHHRLACEGEAAAAHTTLTACPPDPREAGRSKPFDWHPSSINQMWLRVRKGAEIPDVKIHNLRKTFGTFLAQVGVPSLLIQNWMGRTDPTVTREHYIRLPEETKKQLGGLEHILPAGLLKRPPHRNKTVTTLSK